MGSPMLISTSELAAASGVVLFDCRHDLMDTGKGERLYREGHIPGAHFANIDTDLSGAKKTAWFDAVAETDFTHHFRLDDLKPDTLYHFAVETMAMSGKQTRRGAPGSFRTAPRGAWKNLKFVVSTCQHYLTRDTAGGFLSYEAMRRLKPDFTAMVGDNVYYDTEPPIATTPELARHFWHRMYSLPSLKEYYQHTPGYWTKDDHDVLKDDCWPWISDWD